MLFRASKSENLTGYHPESQKLVYMTPEQFLYLCPIDNNKPASEHMEFMNIEVIHEIIESIKAKKEIEIPFLDIDIKTFKVWQHEGRHRAWACKLLKIKRIPVILYFREDGKFINIKGRKLPKIEEIIPQWKKI